MSMTVSEAVIALQKGEVIAYPTEGVFGLGCDLHQLEAVKALLSLKNRSVDKGLILVASSIEQLEPYLQVEHLNERILQTWPGPFTWVLPASKRVPSWIRGRFDTLAVRVSDHPTVQALCQEFHAPIVSTSANPAGQLPALNCQQVANYFGKTLPCVAGKVGRLAHPTQIWDSQSLQQLR